MKSFLVRYSAPTGLVLVAAALVIGAFELVDLVVDSSPAAETGGEEATGIESFAGLIKVGLFMGVGALLAKPLQRRLRNTETQPEEASTPPASAP